MSLLEDVQSMQNQGISDDKIIETLRERNIPYRDIADALTQSKIKVAVEQNGGAPSQDLASAYATDENQMQQSIMSQTQPQPMPSESVPQPGQYYSQAPQQPQYEQQEGQQYQQDYGQQYNYPQQTSADMISEISEQVVAEKLSEIRKHLEKIVDMKTTFESKIEFIDERLKRIEKTIDVLQSSVLRKVGDYVTNVQDLKSEIIATQKSFDKILPSHAHHQQHQSQHKQTQHHNQHHVQHQTHHQHNQTEHHTHPTHHTPQKHTKEKGKK